MCLSVPAKVISIAGQRAKVSVRGAMMEISLQLLDDIVPGDFVLIHAGFALEKIDTEKAAETLKLIDDMEALDEFD